MTSIATQPLRNLAALVAAVALLLVAGPSAASAVPETEAMARLVAIGDVHGELAGLREILRAAGLIDDQDRWSGGTSTLVQLGDFLDRGPEVRGVMDLMMRLEGEARAAGGEVVVLLGNHEQMNLLTIYDDVSRAALERFVDEGSEARRRRAYEEWLSWESAHPAVPAQDETAAAAPSAAERRGSWMEAHPPGWLEYHDALGPDGAYGAWLRDRPVAAIRGGTLFMHAGLSPAYAGRPLAEVERLHAEAFRGFDRVRRYLVSKELAPRAAAYDEIRRALRDLAASAGTNGGVPAPVFTSLAQDFDGIRWTLEGDAPLWFRGYAGRPDAELSPLAEDLLTTHGVDRIVVGHSPLAKASIHDRLGQRVFLIDTGMLEEHYGGRPSALEIAGGRITAIYPDGRQVLNGEGEAPPSPAAATSSPPPRVYRDREGNPLPFQTDEEILDFLRTARIVEAPLLGIGVTDARRLVLERDGRRLRAIFHHIDDQERGPVRVGEETTMYFRDSYRSQLAAYQLARLMGLQRVPPTVERRVGRDVGSVQLWIEDATMWQTIRDEGLEIPDETYFRRQMHDLRVFDNLIHNTDRNTGNILFDPDWHLWWIDNTRSFTLHDDELVSPELVQRCSRELWDALQSLDEGTVRERLRPALSRFDVRALFKRRDLLVELLRERIARLGEERVLFDYDDPPEPAVKVTYEEAEENG